MCTGCYAKVSGEETHSCSGCHDIYVFRIILQGTYHNTGIVTITQIAWYLFAMGKSMQDKYTITDTFGRRQLYSGLQRYFGSGNDIAHNCIR